MSYVEILPSISYPDVIIFDNWRDNLNLDNASTTTRVCFCVVTLLAL